MGERELAILILCGTYLLFSGDVNLNSVRPVFSRKNQAYPRLATSQGELARKENSKSESDRPLLQQTSELVFQKSPMCVEA